MDNLLTWDPAAGFGHPVIDTEILYIDSYFNGCDELREMWAEVVNELVQPQFRNRKHGSKHTAEAGCRGPVCRLEVREISRARFGSKATSKNAARDLLIKMFAAKARELLDQAEQQAVEELLR